jgi:hypothetical protein
MNNIRIWTNEQSILIEGKHRFSIDDKNGLYKLSKRELACLILGNTTNCVYSKQKSDTTDISDISIKVFFNRHVWDPLPVFDTTIKIFVNTPDLDDIINRITSTTEITAVLLHTHDIIRSNINDLI